MPMNVWRGSHRMKEYELWRKVDLRWCIVDSYYTEAEALEAARFFDIPWQVRMFSGRILVQRLS